MKRICKITILMLAVMQAVSMQAMWTQAARTAFAAASKKTLSSHATRSLSSITPDEYVMQSPPGVPKLSIEAVPADAPAIDAESSDSLTEDFEDVNDTYKDFRFKDDAFHKHHFRHKQFLCGSLISALAVYAYMSDEPESAFADEACKADEPTSSRVCDEPEATELIQLQSEPYTYTVNLMWVNRKFEPNQKYIHPSKTLEELEQNLLNTAYGWAASNPESTVNIWYDSTFLIPEAIQNTQEAIDTYNSTHSECAPITLKDVRECSIVQDNLEIFSDKTPVYFRADLLRLIATLQELRASDDRIYFIYADLDVKPITKDELFDQETLKNIEFFGAVMDRETAYIGFENSFHIISNHKKNLLQAIETALISLNIQRAHNALQDNLIDPREPQKSSLDVLSQIVYYSYQRMFDYYCHLESYGTLIVCPKSNSILDLDRRNDITYSYYTFSDHGLDPFGIGTSHLLGDKTGFYFTLENETLLRSAGENPKNTYVPTKKISRPPAKGDYAFALPDSEQPLLSEQGKSLLILGTGTVIGFAAAWWLNR